MQGMNCMRQWARVISESLAPARLCEEMAGENTETVKPIHYTYISHITWHGDPDGHTDDTE